MQVKAHGSTTRDRSTQIKKEDRAFAHTYQIPGRKTSFKRERERKAGLDADGWSVSLNNSKNGRGILVSPVPYRQPTAWNGWAEQGAGREGSVATAQVER